jgi:hypothetical protein
MSRHHSHLFSGRLSASREAAIDAVLAPFDAVVWCIRDGRSYRGWIDSPNLGEPFDRQRAADMAAALQAADLWPIS